MYLQSGSMYYFPGLILCLFVEDKKVEKYGGKYEWEFNGRKDYNRAA